MTPVPVNIPEAASSMRVLHLSSVDHGGAGTAALRLHRAMASRSVDSHMLVWESLSGEAQVHVVGRTRFDALRRFVGRCWYRITSRRRYVFRHQNGSFVPRSRLTEVANMVRPELIIVHYISDFIAFANLAVLQQLTGARVVFHLLDMGLLTGGCHYAWGCRLYRDKCGKCPALPGRAAHDSSARTLASKKAWVEKLDHVVVVPTDQLAKDATGSAIFIRSRFERILIGSDSEALGQRSQATARAELGLDGKAITLFFGAQDLADERKGMHLLVTALQALARDGSLQSAGVQLLIAGSSGGLDGFDNLGVPVIRLGLVSTDDLALCYCAADFFVCPSIEDSGPMMVNESIMSGTPVIGYSIGVLPDLVLEGETGLLAPRNDAAGLAAAITSALGWNEMQREQARKACRSLALARCSLDVQVRSFLALADDTN